MIRSDRVLYAQNLLTREKFEEARRKGANLFLFNEIDFLVEESQELIFYNCTQERVKSTWLSWRENDRIIEKLKSKCPVLFELAGYDITLSVKKAMFWENLKRGFLHYAYENHFKGCKVIELPELHPVNKLNASLRYAKFLTSKKKRIAGFSKQKTEKKLKTIHIKNDFQVGLYHMLLENLSEEKDYQLLIDPRIDSSLFEAFDFDRKKVLPNISGLAQLPIVNVLSFDKEDWFVFNIILLHWEEISNTLRLALEILSNNPKVLLINEGENGIYGAMISEVMKKHGVMVFNTMNGIKSGESQDSFVNFDKWFVWDNQMKRLLMEKNNLPEEKLIVSGHLMEDMVKDYKYKNSLKLDLKNLEGKKVISVFSVRGKRLAKMETLDYLFKLISESDEYFLIIRPHPSEKKEDYYLPVSVNQNNFLFVEYGRHEIKDTLHDQLSLTDVSIVFGSTVALDSRWMNVPCISFESGEESLIYCIDNEWIFHVRSLDELKSRLFELFDKKLKGLETTSSSVSKRILNSLNSYAG